MSARLDPVRLAQDLIRCPSVTPADAGALDVLAAALGRIGMRCHRLPFSADGTPTIDNLYARIGSGGPHFCFAGHTDVVPVGDTASWSVDPFGAEIIDGRLYGRGAVDMKSAIAAFAAAADRFVSHRGRDFAGSISLLITGDEEGPAINGTVKMLAWLKERGETIDACVVGEPTNPRNLGDMVKIGRRGSLVGTLSVQGVQGHTAYPHLADNPLPRLVRMLTALVDTPLDEGTAHFQPSNLQLTTIDVGNSAANVIPARAKAVFNIRFNDLHSGRSLERWLRDRLDAVDPNYALAIAITGESFLTPPGPLSALLVDAIRRVTGRTPELSTTGGTSDARFIKDHCAVAEFGLSGETMHKTDERVALADIAALADIYETVLDGFFSQ